ncbi:MAG: TetR/AcrR family transcriptional regulator [Gammaproteobacteria bacterium]|nr:TetR/AcrR family transcriptional regulator [Gammaproteobacteria bacterium]
MVATPTQTAPGRRKVMARGHARQELLQVAAGLFETHGYRGTSIRDIARATNTSISNIYHHFGNKEGLWQEIQNASVRKLPATLRAAVARQTDPVARFKSLLRAHLEAEEEFRRESRIFFVNGEQLDPGMNKATRTIQLEVMNIYLDELTLLHKHKLIKTRHLKILAFNIFGALNWVLRWHRPEGKLPPAQVYAEVIAFVLRGVGIPD